MFAPSNFPTGRLLTPEEGCGQSKVTTTRIVGGQPAKNGAWPWLAKLPIIEFIVQTNFHKFIPTT